MTDVNRSATIDHSQMNSCPMSNNILLSYEIMIFEFDLSIMTLCSMKQYKYAEYLLINSNTLKLVKECHYLS